MRLTAREEFVARISGDIESILALGRRADWEAAAADELDDDPAESAVCPRLLLKCCLEAGIRVMLQSGRDSLGDAEIWGLLFCTPNGQTLGWWDRDFGNLCADSPLASVELTEEWSDKWELPDCRLPSCNHEQKPT